MRDNLPGFDDLPVISIDDAVEILMRREPICGKKITDLGEIIRAFEQKLIKLGRSRLDHEIALHGCLIEICSIARLSVQVKLVVGPTVKDFQQSPRKARRKACRFHGQVDFSKATLSQQLVAIFAQFDLDANFAELTLKEGLGPGLKEAAHFDRGVFCRGAYFTGVKSSGNLSFAGTQFKGEVSFADLDMHDWRMLFLGDSKTCRGCAKFDCKRSGERAFRKAKVLALQSGRYLAAGDYYYQERVHWWHDRRNRDLWKWVELVFGRYIFGYGERPWRIAATAAAIILLSALGYLFWGVEGEVASERVSIDYSISSVSDHVWPAGSDCWYSLYFSAITFATVGYGEVHPLSGGSRALAAAEGLSGVVLAALFAVSLAKRYSRG